MIYKKFKIANQTITTKLVNHLEENDYGLFNDAKNQILVAKTIEKEGETVDLTEEQMFNTWAHEVVHAFQFYYNNEFDEAQAQVFANFVCEMVATGEPYD